LVEHLAQGYLGQVLAVLRCMAETAEEPAHPGVAAFEDEAAVVLNADSSLKLQNRALEIGILCGTLRHFFILSQRIPLPGYGAPPGQAPRRQLVASRFTPS